MLRRGFTPPIILVGRAFAQSGGPIVPYKGFATSDIRTGETAKGGPLRRGVFANNRISFDREIMRAEAFAFTISDDPEPLQAKELLKEVLARYAKGDPKDIAYIDRAVRTLMVGGSPSFETEEECRRFTLSIPGGAELMRSDKLDPYAIQKLAMQIEFNRFPIEYNGRKGLACIPEISLFNHSCDANAEILIKQHEVSKWFFATVRTTKPINEGEEIVVNYFPGNDLPISRLQMKLRERWGFDCVCGICRSRIMAVLVAIMVCIALPAVYPLHRMYVQRLKKKAAQM
jgi:hypothetical protein